MKKIVLGLLLIMLLFVPVSEVHSELDAEKPSGFTYFEVTVIPQPPLNSITEVVHAEDAVDAIEIVLEMHKKTIYDRKLIISITSEFW